jgi:hypothetical protein
MKVFKLFAATFLIFNIGILNSLAQNKMETSSTSADFKILAEGNYAKVDAAFIFVARDEETYKKLQTFVDNLPNVSKIDFAKYAVIAGFGGEKSKGGYKVNIRKTEGKYHVEIKSPGKDMMSTQVITTPFQVVQISLDEKLGLPITFSDDFSKHTQNFTVGKNSFGFSGGFAGIQKKFTATGTIGVLRYQDFVTMTFDLKADDGNEKRKLFEAASGTLKESIVNISRLDAGTFCNHPHPPFSVNGFLRDKSLSLNFIGHENYVSDGFQGHGSLEASLSLK